MFRDGVIESGLPGFGGANRGTKEGERLVEETGFG